MRFTGKPTGRVPPTLAAVALLVFVVAAAAYAPKLPNGFTFDDRVFIQTDPALRSLPGALHEFTVDQARLYRPLRSLALASLIHFFGLDSSLPFQVAGILFHAALSALVVCLAWFMLNNVEVALLAGLVFALHPVHADRVANITGSFDLLGLVLAYAAWICALEYDRWGGRGRLAVGAVLLGLGCFASEEALMVWGWLFAYFALRSERTGPSRWTLIVFGAVAAVYLLARTSVLSGVARTGEYAAGNLASSLYTTAVIIWRYIGLLFWPVGLTPAYGPTVYHSVSLPVAVGFAALAVLAVLALALRRRTPAVTWGLLWFFAALVPFANLLPSDTLMAERYLYAPLGGFALLAGWAGTLLSQRRRAAVALLVILLAAYALGAVGRARAWGDPLKLWGQAAMREPNSFLANLNAGYHLIRVNRLAEAKIRVEKARQLEPRRAEPLLSLAEIAFREKRDRAGLDLLLLAVKTDPANCTAKSALAQAFVKTDDPVSATLAAQEALACNPADPTANYVAGYLSYLGRRCDLARRYLHAVVNTEPRPAQYQAAIDLLSRCHE